eukprot:s457_g4.t1
MPTKLLSREASPDRLGLAQRRKDEALRTCLREQDSQPRLLGSVEAEWLHCSRLAASSPCPNFPGPPAMWRMSSLLCWMASCQKFNLTQEPSCLLQLAPQAEPDPTCISSSQWTEQFFVEPQPPPVPERGSHWTSAALKGTVALMSWSQFVTGQPAIVPALALIYSWEDGEWKLNANLTAWHPGTVPTA